MFFEDLSKCLTLHAEKYPLMTPCDSVKLLYQSVYGCGHFVTAGMAEERLRAEFRLVNHINTGLFEPICNGRARLMLSAIGEDEIPLVARMFAASAEEDASLTVDDTQFEKGLDVILSMAKDGMLPFSEREARAYIHSYLQSGGGAVSHSEVYRNNYMPAYRVMSPSAIRSYSIVKSIVKTLSEKGSAVVAIDGMCASGKSTVAAFLASVFDCNIIHVDDFFLPSDKRTTERLSEVGGNMHREKLASVLQDALRGDFSYRPYQCWRQKEGESVYFHNKPLLIVEGSYSMHPELREYYDITAFSKISAEEQLARIKARDPELVDRFVKEWIPMEERYFEAMNISEISRFII